MEKNVPNLSDESLVQQFVCDGDRDAFGELYHRYEKIVYSKVYSMLREHNLAGDITHDIFVKLFFSLGKFNGDSMFKTWLYRVVHNSCLTALQKQQRGSVSLLDDAGDETSTEMTDAFWQKLSAAKVRQTLLAIFPEEAELLQLRYDDELSIKEIGEVVDKSPTAVKTALHRARAHFKEVYDGGDYLPPVQINHEEKSEIQVKNPQNVFTSLKFV
jgi:RNA polymerase sigma-70 factor (ECF subfamily)